MDEKLLTEVKEIAKYNGFKFCSKRHFIKNVYWYSTSSCGLSENFIREFKYAIDWSRLLSTQKLSESLIEEHTILIDQYAFWGQVSAYQTLSEDFIRKYQDRIDWCMISMYQTLSENFIRKILTLVHEESIRKQIEILNSF